METMKPDLCPNEPVPWRIRALRGAVLLGFASVVASVLWAGSRGGAQRVAVMEPEEQSHRAAQIVVVDVPEVEPAEPAAAVLPEIPKAAPVAPTSTWDVKLKVVMVQVDRTAALHARAGELFSRDSVYMGAGHAERALEQFTRTHCAQTLANSTLVFTDKQRCELNADGQLGSVPYGVQLALTSTMLDRKRTRLDVAARLHTRETEAPVKSFVIWNAQGFTATAILNEGQTLAVAGLLPLTSQHGRGPRALPECVDADREVVLLITPDFAR